MELNFVPPCGREIDSHCIETEAQTPREIKKNLLSPQLINLEGLWIKMQLLREQGLSRLIYSTSKLTRKRHKPNHNWRRKVSLIRQITLVPDIMYWLHSLGLKNPPTCSHRFRSGSSGFHSRSLAFIVHYGHRALCSKSLYVNVFPLSLVKRSNQTSIQIWLDWSRYCGLEWGAFHSVDDFRDLLWNWQIFSSNFSRFLQNEIARAY